MELFVQIVLVIFGVLASLELAAVLVGLFLLDCSVRRVRREVAALRDGWKQGRGKEEAVLLPFVPDEDVVDAEILPAPPPLLPLAEWLAEDVDSYKASSKTSRSAPKRRRTRKRPMKR